MVPFDELYGLHAASVHRFCVSQVGDRVVAEDLTHETFMRALAAYQRVRPDGATVRTWLPTIARNLIRDHHRRAGRRRILMLRLQRAPRRPINVEAEAEQRDQLRCVTAALSTMRERDRELIGLRVAADLSYRQIADVLGISESAVKMATLRALTTLRNRLEDTI